MSARTGGSLTDHFRLMPKVMRLHDTAFHHTQKNLLCGVLCATRNKGRNREISSRSVSLQYRHVLIRELLDGQRH